MASSQVQTLTIKIIVAHITLNGAKQKSQALVF